MYNPDHNFDMEESAIKKRIDAWLKCQKYNEKIVKALEENKDKYFQNEKAYHKWKSTDPDIKAVNRAKEKMIAGLTQFMDGLADLKEVSGTWITDPDYLNLLFMTAFAKSTFFEKTLHWARAEETFQKERNTDLPGGYAGNGEEKIVRDYDTQWFSLQFLYRQLEFTRFVPNYDIMAGIWALNNSNDCSKLLDQWYYIHRENIKAKTDLTDYTKGYFFRFNSHMTSEAQAQTLYILNNLFRYSMSKPMGTLEYPPWFCDSTITGKADGDLPYSKNIIPHKINLVDIERLNTAPIIREEIAGMKSVPEEVQEAQDTKIASIVVKTSGKTLEEVEKTIDMNEKEREGYKDKWDGEHKLTFDEGTITIRDRVVVKIRDANGDKVEKLRANGMKYKIGMVLDS
jgi:hypothetical protein